ncbi:HlyD family secretion protein [Sulfurimonas sp.]
MDKYKFKALDGVELRPIVKKVWFASFIILLILVAILFLPWQQTVKGKGTLVAFDPSQRDYPIYSTVDGFIQKFYVKENQFVKKGTPLFKMVDLDPNYLHKLEQIKQDLQHQHTNTQQNIKNVKAQTSNLQEYLKNGLNIYEDKIKQIKDKIKSLQLKKITLEKNLQINKTNLHRTSILFKEGIESQREYEKVQNSYIQAKYELENIDVDIVIERKNITITQEEKEKFINETHNKIKRLHNTLLDTKNRLKSLNQQISNQSITIQRYKNTEVLAQKDGYVVRLYKNDKDRYIKKGEKILYFSPTVTQKALLLKVSDFNMPLIKEGLPVRIMFFGWPALQISGWPKIQYGSFGGIIKKVENISHEKGFFYAYVVQNPNEPWPKGKDLRIGTQATAWVRLSVVPIWYQVWRLMNALPPRMVNPNKEKY